MAFDFPDVPAVDEVVTFGDISYKWNLEKWMRLPKGATNVAVIHDGTLQGDGTAAFPLSIANSVLDAMEFARASNFFVEAAKPASEPPPATRGIAGRRQQRLAQLNRPLTAVQRLAARRRR